MIPDRFVALVFDDYHLKMGGMDNFSQGYLVWARDAARRYVATLKPSDRVAILTTTGETALDFTSDRVKLEQALLKLHTSQDKSVQDMPGGGAFDATHRQIQLESQQSLGELQAIVKRMSVAPGQRTMVLLSPGFELREEPTWSVLPETMGLINRAIQAGVVINTLNVAGLSRSATARTKSCSGWPTGPAVPMSATGTTTIRPFTNWLTLPSIAMCSASRRRT